MSPLDGIRVAGGAVLLTFAALQDLRTRRVGDGTWAIGGLLALLLLQMDLVLGGWDLALEVALLGPFLWFVDAIWERDDEAHPTAATLSTLVLYVGGGAALASAGGLSHGTAAWDRYVVYLAMGVTVAAGFVFYTLGVLRGGADAKALMALALLFPLPPHLGSLPLVRPVAGAEALDLLFPFALQVLMDGSFLFLLVPVGFLVYNAARGDLTLPQALLGYRASVADPPRHVWWMEGVEGGRRVVRIVPRRDQVPAREAASLAAVGVQEAWATPQIPFLVPLLGGLILAVVLGNIFLAILAWA